MLNYTDFPTQLIEATPKCAQRCWDEALTAGICGVKDQVLFSGCFCADIPLLSRFSSCALKACTFGDENVVRALQTAVCVDSAKPSRKSELITLASAGLTLATIVVSMRCWSRISTVNRLWWDDWTALFSLVLLIALGSVGMIGTRMGFGMHYWDTDPVYTERIHQIFWTVEVGYLFDIAMMKASIVFLYLRIFETPGWVKLTKYAMVFFAAKVIAFFFPLIFQCHPLPAIWDPNVDGVCLSVPAISYAGAALSITEDIILLILPIPTLWKLQLDKPKKMLVALLFSVGSFACIASFVRIKALLTFAQTDDLTWDNVDMVILTGVELVAALVCGSLAPCRPLVVKLFAQASTKASSMATRVSSIAPMRGIDPSMHRITSNPRNTPVELHDGSDFSSTRKLWNPINNTRAAKPLPDVPDLEANAYHHEDIQVNNK